MAAGPKLICQELLKDAEKAYHACGYAPGMDLIDSMDDWSFLYHSYEKLIDKLRELVSTLPEGSAESIREQRYGNK